MVKSNVYIVNMQEFANRYCLVYYIGLNGNYVYQVKSNKFIETILR